MTNIWRIMQVFSFIVCFTLLSLPCSIKSAKICVFSVVGFMNYRSAYDTLLEALIDKGHEVTVFSTLPLRVDQQYKNRIRYITPKAAVAHLDSFFDSVSPLEWRREGKHHVLWDILPILTLDVCHLILQDENTQQWLEKDKRYDLFIVDSAWNECGIALAYAFQAKLILFSFHSNPLSWNLEAFGGVNELSWLPDAQYVTTYPLSYFQKLYSIYRSFRWHVYRNSFTFYQVHKVCKKYVKVEGDFPSIRELEQNASIVLVNSHFSEEYARSLPPVFVPVGGVHIRTEESVGFKRSLHSDLVNKVEQFVGRQSTGFILVNIGCCKDTVINLSVESMHALQSAIQQASEIVKFVVLWGENGQLKKTRSQHFSSSKNVMVVGECSVELSTLLAHPQIKALISHGDTLDVQEAIYHSVPLILLPVVFEQDANAERIERLERGIRLEIILLKEEHLVDAVHNIVFNSTFKNNMKSASLSFRDRQVKPLDSAVWWIEYTLRNSDSSLLKPLGIHQTWYSRRSLDVWMFVFFCIFSASALVAVVLVILFKSSVYRFVEVCCNYCCGRVDVKCASLKSNTEGSNIITKTRRKFD